MKTLSHRLLLLELIKSPCNFLKGSLYEPKHELQLIKVRKRRFASACGRLINSAKTMDEIEYSKTALAFLVGFYYE